MHPAAAAFRLMTEDELAELVEDITTNGQLFPIMLDAEGAIVDGRNRLRACQLAGIEPKFARLDGVDARAYVVSANLARRNITKGQQAMGLAVIYPKPEQGKRRDPELRKKLTMLGRTEEAGRVRLSQARAVRHHSPNNLAPQVIAGTISLDEAMTQIQAELSRATGIEARHRRLRDEARDLADLVADDRLKLDEAWAAFQKREDERRQTIEAGRRASEGLLDFCSKVATIGIAAQTGEIGLVTDSQLEQLNRAMMLLRQIKTDEEGNGDVET